MDELIENLPEVIILAKNKKEKIKWIESFIRYEESRAVQYSDLPCMHCNNRAKRYRCVECWKKTMNLINNDNKTKPLNL